MCIELLGPASSNFEVIYFGGNMPLILIQWFDLPQRRFDTIQGYDLGSPSWVKN
jgi:hypothetical protein